MDALTWIIIIFLAFMYIRGKTFWFQDIENMYEKEETELALWAKRDKDFSISMGTISSIEDAKSSEERHKKFCEAHNNYVRLKERFKHDKKAKDIQNDWHAYLKAIQVQLNCERDYHRDFDGAWGQLTKIRNIDENSKIVIDEIEKRFREYLKK
jgi:hypothetical protein